MPKEQINYPQPMKVTTAAGKGAESHTEQDPALYVRWWPSRKGDMDGHVQIALEMDLRYVDIIKDHPNEEPGRTSAWTGILNRDEINKMIRTLRRARDAAYGADA